MSQQPGRNLDAAAALGARSGWVRAALATLLALGAALRVLYCTTYAYVHADEYHQYLNPAWWKLTGLGIRAWEWRDGIRSWVFPFYNGAWLALFMQLGIKRGTTLVWLMRVHWALVNATIVYAAWRGAVSMARALQALRPATERDEMPVQIAGLLAATLCALHAPLVIYSAHVLTELPSMLCILWGLVLTSELVHTPDCDETSARNKAILAGLLLSIGGCLRIANLPLVLVAPGWLLLARQYRRFAAMVTAALLPACVFGLVDAFTWGGFASSFRAYLDFNLVQGGAARFGTEPALWYVQTLFARAPWSLPLLVGLGLAGLRVTWPYILTALFSVAYLSTQPHKEERFILLVWPFVFIAASASTGEWLSRLRRNVPSVSRISQSALALVLACAVLWDADAHAPAPNLASRDMMHCESWAGARKDTTGLMLAVPWSYLAGALWYGLDVPIGFYTPPLLRNPLFNYAIARSGSAADRLLADAGFGIAYESGAYRVRRRAGESSTR